MITAIPGVEIRAMRLSDIGSVNELVSQTLDEYFAPEIPAFFLNQWPNGSYVAVDFSGRLIGYVGGSRLQAQRTAVSLLCVASDRRHSGIGGALLDRLFSASRMEGARSVQLEVRSTNVSAIRFYECRGFMKVELLPAFYNDGGDGIRMSASVFGVNS